MCKAAEMITSFYYFKKINFLLEGFGSLSNKKSYCFYSKLENLVPKINISEGFLWISVE